MSKRASSGQSNTLFNYFQSPNNKSKLNNSSIEDSNTNPNAKKMYNSESDDETLKTQPVKRRRIAAIDSDSDENSVDTIKRAKIKENKPSDSSEKQSFAVFDKSDNWLHNRLDFLKPDKIRDINMKRPDDPDYDERTLHVPDDFLSKQTPAMRQWWVLKSKHLDSVLFFKVGKFYELYHMDAVVGVNNLGFSYMKGEFAHSGFPESAYGRMASSLIEQGFKVARVEQTETPEMMVERCRQLRKAGKFDKVVNREICQITTQATCVYGAQLTNSKQVLPCYMLAIAENQIFNGSQFGVCFVDTSIGTFHLGWFDDDKHCSRLLALFSQHPPGLILIERGRMQTTTLEILKKMFGNIRRDTLAPNSQFYSAQKTVDVLREACYFQNEDNEFHWPLVLKDLINNGVPKAEYDLAIKSLGACVWYLKDSELDIHLLSMKKFALYRPSDAIIDKNCVQRDFMVLDSITIQNLSLLGAEGSLQKTLNYCETAFGKRLLQQWICQPLCVEKKILGRQNAVEELYINNEIRQEARAILKKLPDLERQVAKIHMFGNRFCMQNHPDGRAIFYEAKTYSKRKILDLISTMQGFENAMEFTSLFEGCSSKILRKLTCHPPQGSFVDLSEKLQFFKEAFDQTEAQAQGKIIPQKGVDKDYDDAIQEIEDVHEESVKYLEELQEFFGCKISYFGTDKKRFQIEVPENRTHKVTSEFQLESTKKGSKPAKRYSTSTSKKILADMIRAETKRNKIVQDLNRRIFQKFSDHSKDWEQVIQCLMMLDVLCSFAEYARVGPRYICFPKILPFQDNAFINIKEGIHPCTQLEDFVPNSTKLGIDDSAKIMLLTGPNMGGKSTLMRQVALITIMAQMGCPVPAVSCELTLVDRIFTRLGANDDILQGQSTFLVELSEAAAILQHATCNSFVLLDELGRGTSTHDGNAIATAYVKKLIDMQCCTIFSTHYHSLVEHYSRNDNIQLAHMACMTEDDDKDEDPLMSVTLLYQLREGSCPKSYGFNAAKLAGLPKSIIERAHIVSTKLENITVMRKIFRNLMLCDDGIMARKLISNLKY